MNKASKGKVGKIFAFNKLRLLILSYMVTVSFKVLKENIFIAPLACLCFCVYYCEQVRGKI